MESRCESPATTGRVHLLPHGKVAPMRRMLMPGLVLSLLLAAPFSALAAKAAPAADPPSITAPEPTWNFGEVEEDAKVSHDFVVKNTGKGELRIAEVRTG